LLVSGPGGAWIVHRDGSRRRLGDYREATWSPQARFVGAVRGHDLVAVDPHGAIRWVLSRPGAIHDPRWSPSGYRVAYRSGSSLRVVAGDGSGDRLIARHVPGVAAAWRPGARHVLSYVDRSGTIVTRDVDTARLLARLRPGIAVRRLQWSADGRRLLVTGARGVRLLDASGRAVAHIDAAAGSGFVDAALSPGGERIAIVARRRSDGRHDVLLASVSGSAPAPRVRSPIRLRGPIRSVTWSPDGRIVLADWPGSDQWLFLPFSRQGAASAVVGISAHFDPGRARPREGVRVEGWCCS
jgi:WD40-like Beta Propeller Repeat